MHTEFRKNLLGWYHKNKRSLPWRSSNDPYLIWLSEIILQQTRIEQGLPYFLRFQEKYKDVYSLAAASEDEVLKLWQGLGYYSRARNMHHTANIIVQKYKGEFPTTYEELIKLKGIGSYTASLICSVCFNLPFAVLDGNVFRLIARLFEIAEPINLAESKQLFQKKADQVLDATKPGDFNQAMMELGALVCTPQNPDCLNCTVNTFCEANRNKTTGNFPVRIPKEKVKKRYLNFCLIFNNNKVVIEKRIKRDIWKSLYQPVMIEKAELTHLTSIEVSNITALSLKNFRFHSEISHLLTHRQLIIRFYIAETDMLAAISDGFIWISINELPDFAFPKPIEIFIRNIFPDLFK